MPQKSDSINNIFDIVLHYFLTLKYNSFLNVIVSGRKKVMHCTL